MALFSTAERGMIGTVWKSVWSNYNPIGTQRDELSQIEICKTKSLIKNPEIFRRGLLCSIPKMSPIGNAGHFMKTIVTAGPWTPYLNQVHFLGTEVVIYWAEEGIGLLLI